MSEYNLDLQYNDTYGENEVNFKEFESCTFTNCDFPMQFYRSSFYWLPI
jgi:hypothetical protein